MTLAEAEEAAGFRFILPDHPLANDLLIRNAYYEEIPGDPTETDPCLASTVKQGAVDYQTGILVTVEKVAGTRCSFDTDPGGVYRAMADTSPIVGDQVKSILGSPALVIPADASGPAVVDITLNGERVTLYADYSPLQLSVLEEVAQTLS